MQSTCTTCGETFVITDDEQTFIERVSLVCAGKTCAIPLPTMCFHCRLQRRLAHRNEKNLYHRKCDKTGRQIISLHHDDKPYTIYDQAAWWGDGWNAGDYGQEYDFTRPFFEQFQELQHNVPRMSLQQENNENSDYTTNVSHLKNCYLLFSSDFNQDCGYGIWIERSRDCYDNFMIDECELAYECVYANKIYNSSFIYFSSNCQNSAFLINCKGCQDCFMCSGLRNKQYCVLNKQYTKEEYEKKRAEFSLSSYQNLQAAKQRFAKLRQESVYPALRSHGRVSESSGDFLTNVENCQNCYEVLEGKDCRNVTSAFQIKDIMDCNHVHGELAYMSCECFPTPQHSAFNLNCYTGSDLYYCDMCMQNCQNLFGCVSMKHAEYCILNKQYTKEEYEALLPKVIEHMTSTGEWGQFFPESMSPFGYNESEASALYPLSRDDALKRGWQWYDDEDKEDSYLGPVADLPDSLADARDDVTSQIFRCAETKKPYKIIPQEIEFYRKMQLALPRHCPDQRHARRLAERNPRTLHQRQCAKTGEKLWTTYAPDRPETIYSESAFQDSLQ